MLSAFTILSSADGEEEPKMTVSAYKEYDGYYQEEPTCYLTLPCYESRKFNSSSFEMELFDCTSGSPVSLRTYTDYEYLKLSDLSDYVYAFEILLEWFAQGHNYLLKFGDNSIEDTINSEYITDYSISFTCDEMILNSQFYKQGSSRYLNYIHADCTRFLTTCIPLNVTGEFSAKASSNFSDYNLFDIARNVKTTCNEKGVLVTIPNQTGDFSLEVYYTTTGGECFDIYDIKYTVSDNRETGDSILTQFERDIRDSLVVLGDIPQLVTYPLFGLFIAVLVPVMVPILSLVGKIETLVKK